MIESENKSVGRSVSISRLKFRLKFSLITAAVAFSLAQAAGCGSDGTNTPVESNSTAVQPQPTTQEPRFLFPEKDYSSFDHTSEQHARLPCLVCHTREDNSPKMEFTGHIPCSSCHTEHFADAKHSICSVCHIDAEAGSLKTFPTIASFATRFDHAKHLPHANCADCHRSVSGGRTYSVPTRSNSHATCFQCHDPAAEFEGREMASCSTCHQSGTPGKAFGPSSTRQTVFSHARHASGQRLSCSSCHTVRAGAVRRGQVSAPAVKMHLAAGRGQSCASCHNGKRAFNGEDFANCKRCHQGPTFRF